VILISVAMMFRGLRCWVDAGWKPDPLPEDKDSHSPKKIPWSKRTRPVLHVLATILMTQLLGTVLFFTTKSSWFLGNQKLHAPIIVIAVSVIPFVLSKIPYPRNQDAAPSWLVLKALNLCFASTVISTITLLNFSLAALLAVTLGLPLSLARPASSKHVSGIKYILYALLASGWLFLHTDVRDAVWQWEILSVWFGPFVCLMYFPLVIQAGIVCVSACS